MLLVSVFYLQSQQDQTEPSWGCFSLLPSLLPPPSIFRTPVITWGPPGESTLLSLANHANWLTTLIQSVTLIAVCHEAQHIHRFSELKYGLLWRPLLYLPHLIVPAPVVENYLFFTALLAIQISSFVKYLFKSLPHFFPLWLSFSYWFIGVFNVFHIQVFY